MRCIDSINIQKGIIYILKNTNNTKIKNNKRFVYKQKNVNGFK